MAEQPGTAPQPYVVVRRGPAAWLVVLLTLVGVVLVAAVFVAGVLTGASLGGPGQGTTAGSAVPVEPDRTAPDDPAEPGGDAGPAPGQSDGSFDDCLVGSWRTVEHEESYDTEQGAASITGLTRLVDFGADGAQTITYEDAGATVTTEAGALPARFDGVVRYRASTSGTTMSFELLSSEGTVTISTPDGGEQVEDLVAGAGEVTYTCEGDTFTQDATGFSASYERTS